MFQFELYKELFDEKTISYINITGFPNSKYNYSWESTITFKNGGFDIRKGFKAETFKDLMVQIKEFIKFTNQKEEKK